MEPSENWTRFERWEVSEELRRRQRQLMLNELPDTSTVSERDQIMYRLFDIEQRLHFLETMPASFLEQNRVAVLRGKILKNGQITDGEN